MKRGITPIQTSFNKGVYHYSGGSYDEAIAEFKEALDENPQDYRSRFNLAVALEAKAESGGVGEGAVTSTALRKEAEAEYLEILRQRPQDIKAQVNLSACEYDQGEIEKSKKRLRDAMDQHPRLALPVIALSARLLLEAQKLEVGSGERQKLIEETLQLLEVALDRDPSSVEANMLYGETHILIARSHVEDQGNTENGGRSEKVKSHLDKARKAFTRAMHKEHLDIAILMQLSQLEIFSGNDEEAIPWLQNVLFIDPDHYEAHLLLANIFEKQGDLEDATWHLWTARRLEDIKKPRVPPTEYKRRLLRLYQQLLDEEKKS